MPGARGGELFPPAPCAHGMVVLGWCVPSKWNGEDGKTKDDEAEAVAEWVTLIANGTAVAVGFFTVTLGARFFETVLTAMVVAFVFLAVYLATSAILEDSYSDDFNEKNQQYVPLIASAVALVWALIVHFLLRYHHVFMFLAGALAGALTSLLLLVQFMPQQDTAGAAVLAIAAVAAGCLTFLERDRVDEAVQAWVCGIVGSFAIFGGTHSILDPENESIPRLFSIANERIRVGAKIYEYDNTTKFLFFLGCLLLAGISAYLQYRYTRDWFDDSDSDDSEDEERLEQMRRRAERAKRLRKLRRQRMRAAATSADTELAAVRGSTDTQARSQSGASSPATRSQSGAPSPAATSPAPRRESVVTQNPLASV